MTKTTSGYQVNIKYFVFMLPPVFLMGFLLGGQGKISKERCATSVNSAISRTLRLPETVASENKSLNAALEELRRENRNLTALNSSANQQLDACQQINSDTPDLRTLCESVAEEHLLDNYQSYCEGDRNYYRRY